MINSYHFCVIKHMAVLYANIAYPTDHWALKRPSPEDKNFVAEFLYDGNTMDLVRIGVKMNPSDSRGYRAIVVLVHNNMASTLNRPYTSDEVVALNLVLAIVSQAYATLGCLIQVEIAGNNSQSYDPITQTVIAGKSNEPSMLHGHLIVRGKIGHQYVEGVPLLGPVLGELFNMRGDSKNSPGNEKKEPWLPGQIEKVASAVARGIREIKMPTGLIVSCCRSG